MAGSLRLIRRMNWITLKSPDQLEALRAESKNQPVIIFKHSTRCSVSQTALSRLERNWKDEEMTSVKSYYLDLLSYREISEAMACPEGTVKSRLHKAMALLNERLGDRDRHTKK